MERVLIVLPSVLDHCWVGRAHGKVHVGEVPCLLCCGDLFVLWAPSVATPPPFRGRGVARPRPMLPPSLLRHGILGARWGNVFLGCVRRFSLVVESTGQVGVEWIGFRRPKKLGLVCIGRVRWWRLIGGRLRRPQLDNHWDLV